MEIQIQDNTVRRVRGGVNAPMSGLAIQARIIANFLPLECQRAGAKIVHDADKGYTGVRFETKVGPVVLEMPEGDGDYRIVHEEIGEGESGRKFTEKRHFPQIYKPQGIALFTADFLKSRGYLK